MSSIHESLNAIGKLTITLISEDGIVKEKRNVNNLVVTTGKNHIAARMSDTGIPAEMSHMAIGDSDAATSVSDTTLASELARVAYTSATDSDNTITYSALFGAGVGTGALTEAGIFNDSSAGTMLSRTTFAEVNKLAGDTVTINWSITIS